MMVVSSRSFWVVVFLVAASLAFSGAQDLSSCKPTPFNVSPFPPNSSPGSYASYSQIFHYFKGVEHPGTNCKGDSCYPYCESCNHNEADMVNFACNHNRWNNSDYHAGSFNNVVQKLYIPQHYGSLWRVYRVDMVLLGKWNCGMDANSKNSSMNSWHVLINNYPAGISFNQIDGPNSTGCNTCDYCTSKLYCMGTPFRFGLPNFQLNAPNMLEFYVSPNSQLCVSALNITVILQSVPTNVSAVIPMRDFATGNSNLTLVGDGFNPNTRLCGFSNTSGAHDGPMKFITTTAYPISSTNLLCEHPHNLSPNITQTYNVSVSKSRSIFTSINARANVTFYPEPILQSISPDVLNYTSLGKEMFTIEGQRFVNIDNITCRFTARVSGSSTKAIDLFSNGWYKDSTHVSCSSDTYFPLTPGNWTVSIGYGGEFGSFTSTGVSIGVVYVRHHHKHDDTRTVIIISVAVGGALVLCVCGAVILVFFGTYVQQRRRFALLLQEAVSSNNNNTGSAGGDFARKLLGRQTSLWASGGGADWQIPYEELEVVGRPIGRGAYGVVNAAFYRGTKVAVKTFFEDDMDYEDEESVALGFAKEVEILSALHHPNVVLMIGACLDPLCVVMEFIPRGSLFDIIRKTPNSITPSRTKRIALGTARGMAYLHGRGIIHRDLKAANILVDEHWTVKLCDFGISRAVGAHSMTAGVGTTRWTAPEVLRQDDLSGERRTMYGPKADVYGFAMVLYELACKHIPWNEHRFGYTVEKEILEGRRPSLPAHVSEYLRGLIERCWAEDPHTRPTFQAIIKELDGLRDTEFKEVAMTVHGARFHSGGTSGSTWTISDIVKSPTRSFGERFAGGGEYVARGDGADETALLTEGRGRTLWKSTLGGFFG